MPGQPWSPKTFLSLLDIATLVATPPTQPVVLILGTDGTITFGLPDRFTTADGLYTVQAVVEDSGTFDPDTGNPVLVVTWQAYLNP